MLVEQETAVAVRARLHGARRLEGSAVKQRPPQVVARFDFYPHVEGIDGAAGKEVSNLPRAHDHFETYGLASCNGDRSSPNGPSTSAAGVSTGGRPPGPNDSSPTPNVRCLLDVTAGR